MKAPSSRLVAVLLLAAVGFLSNATLLRRSKAAAPTLVGNEAVGSYLRRFEPLRRTLPAHATVGYESDLEDSLSDREEVKRFYLAQYALAPVILVAGTTRELVVGNYRDPSRCRLCRSNDFVLAKDFGNGVMLFRKSVR